MIRIISGLHLSRADAIAGYSGSKMGRSAEERNIEVLRLAFRPADAIAFWRDRTHYTTGEGVIGLILAPRWARKSTRKELATQRNGWARKSTRKELATQRNGMVLWAAGYWEQ